MQEGDLILYVEDDDAYAQIMACVLEQTGFKHRFIHLNSGAKTIAYLEGVGEYADRDRYPLPGMILADLKMPEMNGLELLTWIRATPEHCHIPYVILTSSDDMKDVTTAYQLGANSFLFKPPSVPDLTGMMKAVERFWVTQKVLPISVAVSMDIPALPAVSPVQERI